MHSSPPAIQSFRFSTAVLTPRERSGALHNLRELGILPIEPLADLRPHMAIAKRILPGVAIMSGTLACDKAARDLAAPPATMFSSA